MNIIIIPARYASVRYPGKPLAMLESRNGVRRPLIEWTWRVAKQTQASEHVYIATDDERIAETAKGFGASVLMTSSECKNGTERCADALKQLEGQAEVVVNLQGDAPLTPPHFIDELLAHMGSNPDTPVATPVLRTEHETIERLLADRSAGRVGATTAVKSPSGKAMYFSKEILPYIRRGQSPETLPAVFHHVGIYAYRPDALAQYIAWPSGALETQEGLEQLRFLENDMSIDCVTVEARDNMFWELNNPEDIELVQASLY